MVMIGNLVDFLKFHAMMKVCKDATDNLIKYGFVVFQRGENGIQLFLSPDLRMMLISCDE